MRSQLYSRDGKFVTKPISVEPILVMSPPIARTENDAESPPRRLSAAATVDGGAVSTADSSPRSGLPASAVAVAGAASARVAGPSAEAADSSAEAADSPPEPSADCAISASAAATVASPLLVSMNASRLTTTASARAVPTFSGNHLQPDRADESSGSGVTCDMGSPWSDRARWHRAAAPSCNLNAP